MQYRTSVDNVTLVVDLDAPTPTLELRGDHDGVVRITADQTGLIVLVRRAFNDLFEEQKRRRYEEKQEASA